MKIHHLLRESVGDFPVPLYVGAMTASEGVINFKFRDKPRNTIPFIHDMVDQLTQAKFGLPLRSLFFCTPDPDHAATYGNLFEVYPQGNWRAFVSPEIADMTLDVGLMHYHIEARILREFEGEDKTHVERVIKAKIDSRHLSQIKSLDEFTDVVAKIIPDDVVKDVPLEEFKTSLVGDLHEYVDSIEELTNTNAYDLLTEGAEVMLYSPDGINLESV